MVSIEPVIVALLASLAYSSIFYAKKNVGEKAQKFELGKWLSTITLGGVIGLITVMSGIPITQVGLETQIAAYAGLIAVIEAIGQMLFRFFFPVTETAKPPVTPVEQITTTGE